MNKLSGIQPDPILINSDASDIALSQTVATASDPEQPNTTGGIDSNTSVPRHQQDNSSEDISINPLPKNNEKYIIFQNLCVESWIESTSL